MTLAYLGLLGCGVVLAVCAMVTAPLGYEDADGFHYAEPQARHNALPMAAELPVAVSQTTR